MARDFKFHSGHRFSEAIRKAKSGALKDSVMSGHARTKTGLEGMSEPEESGSGGSASKHFDKKSYAKPKGKFNRIEVEPRHTIVNGKRQVTHMVRVHHHQEKQKTKHGSMPPYKRPSEHLHTNLDDAKQHVSSLMDNLEPEEQDNDSGDLASSIY